MSADRQLRSRTPVRPTLIAGRRVLFAMAAAAEYGKHLQLRFEPLMTGVGPVEAAAVMAASLARLDAAGEPPDLVVSLGSAGSRVLEQTGVYQASRVSYRDMDASALGFDKGVTPFLGLPGALDLTLRLPGLPQATLSTGADIVSGDAYDGIEAEMVDMESYAVLRACQLFSVPLVVLRGISDGAAELAHVDDWTQYLHIVDEKLAAAVDRLADALEGGLLEAEETRR
jgi:adenosylhomocysteine nucleosidase